MASDRDRKSAEKNDTDASVQHELRREAGEGAGSIGDVSSNRTLSGSTTWETLPEEDASSDDAAAE